MSTQWLWIGDCPCRGADKDCADDDDNWIGVEGTKTVTLTVTVPAIPEDWDNEQVREWVSDRLTHPVDSFYEPFVEVRLPVKAGPVLPPTEQIANPERENNGCMIYRKGFDGGTPE